jgi:hypothetical protein
MHVSILPTTVSMFRGGRLGTLRLSSTFFPGCGDFGVLVDGL